jgi:hypothetical protein
MFLKAMVAIRLHGLLHRALQGTFQGFVVQNE